MGQQSSVSSLFNKGLACQKIPGTRNHEFGKSTNQDQITIHQTLYLLETILKQNYFQHNDQFYQPNMGIAMGSPISGMLAEIYLQYWEETYIKHCSENKEITHYKRYVDNILIIFDQN